MHETLIIVMMQETTKYDVFISYSRKDYVNEYEKVIPGNEVSRIKKALDDYNITYWFDEDNEFSGEKFTDTIVENIESSRIFIFLSTRNSNESKWTSKEIATADEFGKHIIPVRIDKTPYNKKVMFRIADLDYIDYYKLGSRDGTEKLIRSIKKVLDKTDGHRKASKVIPDHTQWIPKEKFIQEQRKQESYTHQLLELTKRHNETQEENNRLKQKLTKAESSNKAYEHLTKDNNVKLYEKLQIADQLERRIKQLEKNIVSATKELSREKERSAQLEYNIRIQNENMKKVQDAYKEAKTEACTIPSLKVRIQKLEEDIKKKDLQIKQLRYKTNKY